MKIKLFLIAAALSISLHLGCSGGGGGGESDAGAVGVLLLNGAISLPPVNLSIYRNGEPLTGAPVPFGLIGGKVNPGAGQYAVGVNTSGGSAVVKELALQVEGGVSNPILVFENDSGVQVVSQPTIAGASLNGSASLRFVNAVNGSPSISLQSDSGEVSASLGIVSSQLSLTPGKNRLKLMGTVNLDEIEVELSSGRRYILLVSGENNYFVSWSIATE